MTASSLIIVADRGSVRAYRVKDTATRGPSLKLVQAFDIPDVMNATTMRHRTPLTDWPQLEAEMDRRICKELAAEIAKIVERSPGEGWSFAAPASINAKDRRAFAAQNPGADRRARRVRPGEIAGGSAEVALPLASTSSNLVSNQAAPRARAFTD